MNQNQPMQFRPPMLTKPLGYPPVNYPYRMQTMNHYNYTMIFIVISCFICIIVILIIYLSLNGSGNSGKSPITPAPKYDHCDSRLNNGVCPEILNNINGNMCFADFDKNTGSYVVKDPRGQVIWDNKVNDPTKSPPYTLNIESDGNLCVKDSSGKIQWETKTKGVAPFLLKMQDDCNLVLYDSYINKLWETSTTGKNN